LQLYEQKTKGKENMNNKDKQLLDETMMVLSNRLKSLSKKTISDIREGYTEDENGEWESYIGGNKDKHLFSIWFNYSSEEKCLELLCNYQSDKKKNKGYRFPMKEIKKRLNREMMIFWLVSEIYEDDLTEGEFKEYFSDKLGFSIPFSKCFTVIRQGDGEPYTGAKGEEPFVSYHTKYMNQLNGEYCGEQISNLMKVVRKKCDEFGFTLEGGENGLVSITP
jgi:hypothetical protein